MYDTVSGALSVYKYGQTWAPRWPKPTARSACVAERTHVVRDHAARDAGVGDRKAAGSAPRRSVTPRPRHDRPNSDDQSACTALCEPKTVDCQTDVFDRCASSVYEPQGCW